MVLSIRIFAQEKIVEVAKIKGKVILNITGEPLIDGYTIKPDIVSHPISYSGENGDFLIDFLEPNKEYEIVVSAPGFKDHIFKVKTNDNVLHKNFELKVVCDYDENKALLDWEESNAQFLLLGSIAPIANTKSDNKFERKYNINYYDFGCEFINYECIKSYNLKIAELMDRKFGKRWRKNARTDIIGI